MEKEKGSALKFSAATPPVSQDKAQFMVGLGLWETLIHHAYH
jgi:hypothetical protein